MEKIIRQLEAALTLPLAVSSSEEPLSPLNGTSAASFWSGFLAALGKGHAAFVVDPDWPSAWKKHATEVASSAMVDNDKTFRLLLPTSGSTGRPRFCQHDIGTLSIAAHGYAARFADAGLYHAISFLPPFHVGGLLPAFRAVACGGRVVYADYRQPEALGRLPFPLRESALSLVPTQLRRILISRNGTALLRRLGMVLVGGASCPPDLLDLARKEEIHLAPCYGSTETAAMVTVLSPEDFLAGDASCGPPLPHVRLALDPSDECLLISSEANLRAYVPPVPAFTRDPLKTSDLAKLDQKGYLRILGRRDRVLITGGKKVHPETVEAAALQTGLCEDALCDGTDDEEWGQAVRLFAVPKKENVSRTESLLAGLKRLLPPAAVPKTILWRSEIPRSQAGKARPSPGTEDEETNRPAR